MKYLVLAVCLAMFVRQDAFAGPLEIHEAAQPGSFPLMRQGIAANIIHDDQDHTVVGIAARGLAEDVKRVTTIEPQVAHTLPKGASAVIVGSLDKSRLIASLVDAGKLKVDDLRGQWECFKFASVDGNLIIVGSDRRGTAYGVFELSRAIGVSPWNFWADVPPQRHEQLFVALPENSSRIGPPSVKYRGIFINDEDWGLQPWAAKTFEPETGDIGPKTYARVFELLLRLRANYCWPAMHSCTKAFNTYPRNKQAADDYAIVMGSSHCEQMLRNNVTEWPKGEAKNWNPVTNLPAITEYWETRVRENAKFESVWTVGMRGVHDGAMPGGGSIREKRDRMEKIISLQRDLLTRHLNPDPSQVPQIFCPYKEVLEIYQDGLNLPDDITIVWPDDNYGYIRQLPDARERQRNGGHGIYYHLSYLGRPHDYVWLESTSPALIWHEMTKAYDLGAQRLWIANVGDIKPIETGLTLFLDLAWDVRHYDANVQRSFLRDFYDEQFGSKHADEIAAIKDDYFRLCAIRRPEHFGFNRTYPTTPVADSDFSIEEALALLEHWRKLGDRAEGYASELPQESQDAYFQLVEYPTCAAAAMVEKMLLAEQARQTGSDEIAARAKASLQRIEGLTRRYNNLNGGKWNRMMDHRPRKLPVFDMPPTTQPASTQPVSEPAPKILAEIDLSKFALSQERDGSAWRVIDGLGPRGAAIAVLPARDVPTRLTTEDIRAHAPVAEYPLGADVSGEVEVQIDALPTHPFTPAHTVLAAVSFDDGDPAIVRFDQGKDDENDRTWQRNVLRSVMTGGAKVTLPTGAKTLKLWAADPGVVIQRVRIARR